MWEDFIQYFNKVYLCRVFDESFNQYVVASEWRGKAAGGPPKVLDLKATAVSGVPSYRVALLCVYMGACVAYVPQIMWGASTANRRRSHAVDELDQEDIAGAETKEVEDTKRDAPIRPLQATERPPLTGMTVRGDGDSSWFLNPQIVSLATVVVCDATCATHHSTNIAIATAATAVGYARGFS